MTSASTPSVRGGALTGAGAELREDALWVVFHPRGLDDAMAERRGAYRCRVELAIVPTTKYFVPMLLVRFRKNFPKSKSARARTTAKKFCNCSPGTKSN